MSFIVGANGNSPSKEGFSDSLVAERVSHQEAIEKATTEFKKYQVTTLSTVEEDYLRTLKSLEKKLTN